jgi:hypothetical protein
VLHALSLVHPFSQPTCFRVDLFSFDFAAFFPRVCCSRVTIKVDYDSRPSPLAPPTASHFMVYAETPNGLVPNYADVDRDARNKDAADRIASVASGTELPLGPASLGRGVASDAYAPGASADVDENEWTDAETLSLLEGIELHSDDWIKVSWHAQSPHTYTHTHTHTHTYTHIHTHTHTHTTHHAYPP